MDLTVVIPVYNVEKYLPDCLESLPDNCPIILVDDGSTDRSLQICKEYEKYNRNVRLIQKKNGGLSDARNAGMNYVNTKYVFFLDSDDRINAKALCNALKYCTEHNLDWLQCGYAYDYGDTMSIPLMYANPIIKEKEAIMAELVSNGFVKNFAWGKIYRTELIRDELFPYGKFFEDSYWQYRIIHKCHRLGIFPETVLFYRQRQGGISGTFSSRNLDLLKGLSERLDFLTKYYIKLAPTAAVGLWLESILCCKRASEAGVTVKTAYETQEARIRNEYAGLITTGISEQPFPYRQMNHNKWKRAETMYKFWYLLVKIVERVKKSEYRICKVN